MTFRRVHLQVRIGMGSRRRCGTCHRQLIDASPRQSRDGDQRHLWIGTQQHVVTRAKLGARRLLRRSSNCHSIISLRVGCMVKMPPRQRLDERMTRDNPAPLISVEQLGVSVRYVRRIIAERRIPYIKVGHLVRFQPHEVQRWVEANRIDAITGPL